MNEAIMKSVDKAQTDRDAALNKLRWEIDRAAREFERTTSHKLTRVEIFRTGADWRLEAWTINAVAAQDGKVFA